MKAIKLIILLALAQAVTGVAFAKTGPSVKGAKEIEKINQRALRWFKKSDCYVPGSYETVNLLYVGFRGEFRDRREVANRLEEPDYLQRITVRKIEDLHSILVKELGVDKGIRRRRVGVTGTNYRPLDNEFQIREALEDTCRLINVKENVFEKALLVLVLLSYIQAFSDGNKRTARITSNAILIANRYCPISFRSVDSVDYKKAMLIFYEQNNISAFKKIFIDQFAFAVQTYF